MRILTLSGRMEPRRFVEPRREYEPEEPSLIDRRQWADEEEGIPYRVQDDRGRSRSYDRRRSVPDHQQHDSEERIIYQARERHVPHEHRTSRIPRLKHSHQHHSRPPPPQIINQPPHVTVESDNEEEDIQERIILTPGPRSREHSRIPPHVHPTTDAPRETAYVRVPRHRSPIPPPPVYITRQTIPPVPDTTHSRPDETPIIIEAVPPSTHTRHHHRHRHRPILIQEVPRPPRTHETLVPVPPDHDVEQDFFDHGRGMWDFDMLVREGQAEEQRRADRAAARQRNEARRRMRAREEEARLRFELARDELDRMRREARREVSPGRGRYFAAPAGGSGVGGPSRWDEGDEGKEGESRKGKEREKEKKKGDGCCERLLAFLQQDAEIQHYRWREMRAWNSILVGELITSRREAVVSTLQRTTPPVNSQNDRDQGTGDNANNFPRPSVLGGARRRLALAGAERRIKVGFMFLRGGQAVKSKHLHEYSALRDMTEQRDTWLIKRMARFYARHVATRRWFPCKKRLALAKFVRVSGHSYL